jgi:hypothetical protein
MSTAFRGTLLKTLRTIITVLAEIVLVAGILLGQQIPPSNTPQVSVAGVINADPSNYRDLLPALRPGDTLNLAAGTYSRLQISDLNGTSTAWITITGPMSGPPAVIVGSTDSTVDILNSSGERVRPDAISIVNSSYVAIENLRIDSRGIPGAFGISAHGRETNVTHDIRIERNTLVGQNGSQGTDGISTKTPTWGWIIRNNQILGAGTGLYLGDSDGTQPFVAGLIENNLIKDTLGYDMEIKFQVSWPSIPGMPIEPTSTIIRNNVFIKNDQPSPDGDRPNVLLGGFPYDGPGSLNMYEVYGNFFFHNHREALFQASGRVTLHDNVFVDGPYTYPAVVLRSHDHPLKIAYVYNNTIYTSGRGIYFGSRAIIDDAVVGNLVFAMTPISGSIMRLSNNVVSSIEKASLYVNSPSFDVGSMDFYPLPGKCQGVAIDLSPFHADADYTLDFNGTSRAQAKGVVVFRGAYAGEITNPGWQLRDAIKSPNGSSAKPAATLVWISPASGSVGTSTKVTLTGANFNSSATVAGGLGITVSNVAVTNATQISASFGIATSAAVGDREVIVIGSSGKSNSLKFRVNSRRR